MAARGRLAALKLIERIGRHEMQSIGTRLATLRAEQSQIDAKSQALTDRTMREAAESTAETRAYLPAYLRSVQASQAAWAEDRAALEETAAQAETELYAAFRTSKTNEAVLAQVSRTIDIDAARAETAAMDDAARTLFMAQRRLLKSRS